MKRLTAIVALVAMVGIPVSSAVGVESASGAPKFHMVNCTKHAIKHHKHGCGSVTNPPKFH